MTSEAFPDQIPVIYVISPQPGPRSRAGTPPPRTVFTTSKRIPFLYIPNTGTPKSQRYRNYRH